MNTIEHLKSQCNRYANGQCHTRKCLVNGGYTGGPPDYNIATCEYHDAVTQIERLKAEVKRLRPLAKLEAPIF